MFRASPRLHPAVVHGHVLTALQILMAGVLLDVLREANEEAGGIVPYQEFYNQVRVGYMRSGGRWLAGCCLGERGCSGPASTAVDGRARKAQARASVVGGSSWLEPSGTLNAVC